MINKDYSLELLYIDGHPGGMLAARNLNWTGQVLSVPRSNLMEGLKRPEVSRVGCYLLTGDKERRPCTYIGQGINISNRIREHALNKDWWERIIVITSQDGIMDQVRAKYLEARLIKEAESIGYYLDNEQIPKYDIKSDFEKSKIENFFNNLLKILPAVGMASFVRDSISDTLSEKYVSSEFECVIKTLGIKAKAVSADGKFIVMKGSQTRDKWTGDEKYDIRARKIFLELVERGILVQKDNYCVFTKDYIFSSPSVAACIVWGRSENGQTAWVNTKTGQTYKEWEKEQINNENL